MSKNYVKIKSYYDSKIWNIERVFLCVNGLSTGITEQEYNEITGLVYPIKSGE